MPPRSDDRTCYEFDEFRVDPVRRLLLRSGEPVPVTPKALSILLVLLEQPGEVVEKSELIETIWAGSHVTEANLTQNVFALRKCLGERANDPRYVVTVPGRGYSFAGEVRRCDRGETGELPLISDLPAPAAVPATPAPDPPPPERAWHRPSFARWGALIALGILGAILLGFLHVRHPRSRPSAAAAAPVIRQSVAMLDFRSLSPSGETRWLDSALPEMLTTELSAGGTLRVLR
ncbi:MAG TPA: transcriptional regulator, partial [Thermoanaerobaculia bacterium]|nr:transcriptional regulator [Thermoanaerobaculia bacterium]